MKCMKATSAREGDTGAQIAGAGTLTRQGRRTRPCGNRTLVALQTQPSCTASGPALSSALVRPACPLQSYPTVLNRYHVKDLGFMYGSLVRMA